MSILFMAIISSLIMTCAEAVESIREWKYKKTHNKRKPGWWKPNTNF